jgi:hypothetical protein
MHLYLSEEDKNRLRTMATEMGVNVPYHYGHGQPQAMYVMSSDGTMQTVMPDTWLVDMFEEMDKRIKRLEDPNGVY